MAELHHGLAASPRRRVDRTPRDLFEIGASWAVFQRKHMIRSYETNTGTVSAMPKNVVAWRIWWPGGWCRGMSGALCVIWMRDMSTGRSGGARVLETAMAPFKPFSGPRRASVLIAGRIWQREKLRSEAARRVAGGEIATLLLLSPKALFHHVRFHEDG